MSDINELVREIRSLDQNECGSIAALVREANHLVGGMLPTEVSGALLTLRPDDLMIRLNDWLRSGADMADGENNNELYELYEKAQAAQRRLESLLVKIQKMESSNYVTKIDQSW